MLTNFIYSSYMSDFFCKTATYIELYTGSGTGVICVFLLSNKLQVIRRGWAATQEGILNTFPATLRCAIIHIIEIWGRDLIFCGIHATQASIISPVPWLAWWWWARVVVTRLLGGSKPSLARCRWSYYLSRCCPHQTLQCVPSQQTKCVNIDYY